MSIGNKYIYLFILLFSLCSASFLTACKGGKGCSPGIEPDASPVDASNQSSDASSPDFDASTQPDASTSLPDASQSDASAPVADASAPDGGTSNPDAGVPQTPSNVVKITLIPRQVGNDWVSLGVPMPSGVLIDKDKVRLVDSDGNEIPSFTSVIATWRKNPPKELLCNGVVPEVGSIRSLLLQFPYNFDSTSTVDVFLQIGPAGQRLLMGVPVRSTYVTLNDGKLYNGTEGLLEPKTYGAVDHNWLSCSNLADMSGLSDKTESLNLADQGRKNFFYTTIKDYRSNWNDPSGSWKVGVKAKIVGTSSGPFQNLNGKTIVVKSDQNDPRTLTLDVPQTSTIQQVVNYINSQVTTIRASSDNTGKLVLETVSFGPESSLTILSGSSLSILGFTEGQTDKGEDYPGVDLYASDDGTWLYDRPKTYYNGYFSTGIVDMLIAAQKAAFHYSTLIYTPEDCAQSRWKDWCVGFFKIKNPDPNSSWKDYKYSYVKSLSTYYLMTGDQLVLPVLGYLTSATKKIGAQSSMITERFTAVALEAPVYEYEITGDESLLVYVKTIVDFLYNLQNQPNSEGLVTGCFSGNVEWAPEGFSPWMTPMMMESLLHVYSVTSDERIPSMLSKASTCIANRGIAWTTEIQGVARLIPFYGGKNAGPSVDADGNNPWAGIEHSINVATGISLGMYFTQDPVERERLKDVSLNLVKSHEWVLSNWTRTTVGLPKFRVAPWRKFNWWTESLHILDWAFSRPSM